MNHPLPWDLETDDQNMAPAIKESYVGLWENECHVSIRKMYAGNGKHRELWKQTRRCSSNEKLKEGFQGEMTTSKTLNNEECDLGEEKWD